MAIVNKDELARAVAAQSGLEVGQAKSAVDATLAEITKQMAAGNEVRLTGFGKSRRPCAPRGRDAIHGPESRCRSRLSRYRASAPARS